MAAGRTERILIVESKRGQAARWQRELRSSGYLTVPTASPERALRLLSEEPVALMIVLGEVSARPAEELEAAEESPDIGSAGSAQAAHGDQRTPDPYYLCRVLKSDPRGRATPLLLIASASEEDGLARGLEAGADYFLFAPLQPQELIRSVRMALLNGVAEDPAEAGPGIEVFHQDRVYTLTAGRARLARALISLYADLRHTKSSWSWSQAELRELRDRLRRERHHVERDVMLNEMVQGIAHDFGNLMETVGAAAAAVSSGNPQSAPYRSALDAALAQAETLISIVQNFVLFGEEQMLLAPVDPAGVVREVLEAAMLPLRAPFVRVQARVDGLPPMRTNATLLARCLNNLIWNAVQAMPSGGVLDLSGAVENGRVFLEISDTGSGIAKDMQENIFDTRYSTKSGHRGIGLSLVRSLLRRSGGDISLVHRPGRGTAFALAFPAVDRESLPSPPAAHGKRALPVR